MDPYSSPVSDGSDSGSVELRIVHVGRRTSSAGSSCSRNPNEDRMLEYDVEDTPLSSPPFIPDVLCIIFGFLGSSRDELMHLSLVNRMWSFYAGYLRAWSELYMQRLLFSQTIHMKIAAAEERLEPDLAPPMHVDSSRDALWEYGNAKLRAYEEKLWWDDKMEQIASWVVPICSAFNRLIIMNGIIAAILVGYGQLAWTLGINDTGLPNDGDVGAAYFFAVVALIIVKYVIAVCFADNDAVPLVTAMLLRAMFAGALIGMVAFMPLALVANRVNSLEYIKEGGVANLSESAMLPAVACSHRRGEGMTAFIEIPAPLNDTRWRHYPSGKTLWQLADDNTTVPTCLQTWELANNATEIEYANTSLCFTLVQFVDTQFASGMGFDPNERCALTSQRPLLVAVQATGAGVAAFAGRAPSTRQLRTVRRSGYYDADTAGTAMASWYITGNAPPTLPLSAREAEEADYEPTEYNPYWDEHRIHLVNPDAALQSMDAVSAKEDDLYDATRGLIIAAIVLFLVCVIFDVLNMLGCCNQGGSEEEELLAPGLMMMAFAVVFLNPFTLTGFGIACIAKGSAAADPTWLMCDQAAGIGMTTVGGIMLLITIANILCN